jgi:hypothetical protein
MYSLQKSSRHKLETPSSSANDLKDWKEAFAQEERQVSNFTVT